MHSPRNPPTERVGSFAKAKYNPSGRLLQSRLKFAGHHIHHEKNAFIYMTITYSHRSRSLSLSASCVVRSISSSYRTLLCLVSPTLLSRSSLRGVRCECLDAEERCFGCGDGERTVSSLRERAGDSDFAG